MLVAVFLLSFTSLAQGDLLLYPKRIVFEGNKKSQVLNLSNIGKDTVRYFISVVQIRMKEDGSVETITVPDSAQNFADKNFRFFPRSVLLGPNESQTVKLQVINTSQLAAGEYRSHLMFRAEADKKPLGEKESNDDSTSISVNVVAVFGISIPVILRTGESTTKITLSNPSLVKKDSLLAVKVSFNRNGNMSVYGDISINHISPSGKTTQVAIAKGAAIYAPNTVRYFNLLLDKDKGVDFTSGKLRITYATPADARSEKMAETELNL